VSPDFEVGSK